MLMTVTYPLRIERYAEEDGCLACFPDQAGCQTWGRTFEAAIGLHGDTIPIARTLSDKSDMRAIGIMSP
jgi:hypothetical protein